MLNFESCYLPKPGTLLLYKGGGGGKKKREGGGEKGGEREEEEKRGEFETRYSVENTTKIRKKTEVNIQKQRRDNSFIEGQLGKSDHTKREICANWMIEKKKRGRLLHNTSRIDVVITDDSTTADSNRAVSALLGLISAVQ